MILKRLTSKPKQAKPLPFTDQAIQERAYELWQANPEGSAESHWQGAIEALRRERSPGWKLRQSWQTATHKDNRVFTLDVLKVLISGFGVLATVFAGVGLYLTYRTGQEQQQLNTERLVTDRFAKAVEQLGNADIDVRIGGIYSLERIARDSPKDHWTIMEVLTAFVRNKSTLPKDWDLGSEVQPPSITADIQSALTVIGRREVKNDPEVSSLDLQHTNLSVADLHDAKLSKVSFYGASLYGASLCDASLSNANLEKAQLNDIQICSGSLLNADLRGSNLKHINDITTTQIKTARNWQGANYTPKFRQQLGLPPEKPNP